MALGAIGDVGQPVDWWFVYKVAGKATTAGGQPHPTVHGSQVRGVEYLYADSSSGGQLALSVDDLDAGGCVDATVSQIFGSGDGLGWFCYNDENPLTGAVNSSRGHTKGVLAFDLESDTAFWLIQSTPKFPGKPPYAFPRSGTGNAQTMLCITLSGVADATSIAKQMTLAQEPNVYLASPVPKALAGQPDDPKVVLLEDRVAPGATPFHSVFPFTSKGGQRFSAIAKNRAWGLDFYNDLVGPTLAENLEVETWENDPRKPTAQDDDRVHTVVDMQEVDCSPLGIDLAWPESDDHAKLALSAPHEATHYVCVGDLNFTLAQRKRGGGTVAFQCDPLWDGLMQIVRRLGAAPDAPADAPSTPRTSRPAHHSRRTS